MDKIKQTIKRQTAIDLFAKIISPSYNFAWSDLTVSNIKVLSFLINYELLREVKEGFGLSNSYLNAVAFNENDDYFSQRDEIKRPNSNISRIFSSKFADKVNLTFAYSPSNVEIEFKKITPLTSAEIEYKIKSEIELKILVAKDEVIKKRLQDQGESMRINRFEFSTKDIVCLSEVKNLVTATIKKIPKQDYFVLRLRDEHINQGKHTFDAQEINLSEVLKDEDGSLYLNAIMKLKVFSWYKEQLTVKLPVVFNKWTLVKDNCSWLTEDFKIIANFEFGKADETLKNIIENLTIPDKICGKESSLDKKERRDLQMFYNAPAIPKSKDYFHTFRCKGKDLTVKQLKETISAVEIKTVVANGNLFYNKKDLHDYFEGLKSYTDFNPSIVVSNDVAVSVLVFPKQSLKSLKDQKQKIVYDLVENLVDSMSRQYLDIVYRKEFDINTEIGKKTFFELREKLVEFIGDVLNLKIQAMSESKKEYSINSSPIRQGQYFTSNL